MKFNFEKIKSDASEEKNNRKQFLKSAQKQKSFKVLKRFCDDSRLIGDGVRKLPVLAGNELLSLWVTGPETPTKVGLTVKTLILTKVDKLDRIGGS